MDAVAPAGVGSMVLDAPVAAESMLMAESSTETEGFTASSFCLLASTGIALFGSSVTASAARSVFD